RGRRCSPRADAVRFTFGGGHGEDIREGLPSANCGRQRAAQQQEIIALHLRRQSRTARKMRKERWQLLELRNSTTYHGPVESHRSIMARRSLPKNGSPSTKTQGDPNTPRATAASSAIPRSGCRQSALPRSGEPDLGAERGGSASLVLASHAAVEPQPY